MILSSVSAHAESRPLTLITASDPHYISSAINDNGAMFRKITESGDGKVSLYCRELFAAFLTEVIRRKPAALIISGDLSFNGARQSHEDIARQLSRVKAAGIPVLVTTGNHDVNYPQAASFSGDSYSRLPMTSSAEFREIYAEFGYDDAIDSDPASLSYVYKLTENTRILVLDLNVKGHSCEVQDATMRWIEQALRDAKRAGCTVIAVGHQNLFKHSIFSSGYVIPQGEALRRLFETYGVRLFLSGHMHVQHIMTVGGVTEIATGSLSTAPCRYGVLTVSDSDIEYHTQDVDVSAYAAKLRANDPNLTDFTRYARNFMTASTARQFLPALQKAGLAKEEILQLLNYICAMNRAYFAGETAENRVSDPSGKLLAAWKKISPGTGVYLESIAKEAGKDHNRLKISR